MRIQESGLSPEAQRTVFEVLTSNPSPGDMPQEGSLLYLCSNRVEFAGQMSSFDEWGLRLVGLVGPRENPVVVAPLLAANTDLAPRVDTGGRASLEAGGAGVEVPTPPGVPEAPSSGTREARPGAAVEGEMQSAAPGAGAPETPACQHEAEPDCSS